MRIIIVTCPPDGAVPLLRTLVEERLVACGNILGGVRSIYRWRGDICDEREEVLLMETSDVRVPAMMARLRELHPYEVPKILALEPAEKLPEYEAWVDEETSPPPP
jgi:periplasmic divalent cation tolerance protein